ncbi:MAG: UDP-N-acetylglucosamine-N-acetylmuramyl- (pentapeptide) pyrophosphoryl-UDP N- acetylglucosamine transferase [Candidatus Magasanikbacteria bacterium GW2011_GWA2_40_10]|uniref:UDP-N-acetylglucosamine-N-acetylmuramyl-(Pentapeptide) pyrophosphoryl-UDP N-acetylglucosamine transferase n=1 Tax=Candidatus Magasanikbacteria bacterium GW2011_GWA2_40_10 TaxID=1619037 RepID=A0A0G0Q271_9BACT|nr:MAG: UDP-N-acetylglucosamine-N-acetylmuramyl- (pentapeptide) pyrophosphoryl-UDP N- acetylglucosamine transferase [Candidatus Magasanikbacteria bacterium GW2011_GWA2_40_10]
MGPVVPLLAIAEIYHKHNPQVEFIWVGTKNGPEKELVDRYHIPFFTITSGKLRRYTSLWNFFDIFKIIFGFFQSLFLLWHEKPSLLITAGGFVSVPLHFAAYALGIPAWVHQQDSLAGLANKIMSRIAKKITTALRESEKDFPENKTEWIGNPVRNLSVADINESRRKFSVPQGAPVILAMGGGTGSASINKLVMEAVSAWPREYQVIHLVGKERPRELQESASKVFPNYHVYQFLKEEIKDAYAIADVVIARAGFATITELAALGKPAILLPMSGTHQEVNSKLLADHQAAIVMDEKVADGLKLARTVVDLIAYPETRRYLGERLQTILPPAKPQRVVDIIEQLVEHW